MFNLSSVTALSIEMEHADFVRTLSHTNDEATGEHYLFDLVVDAITHGIKVNVVDKGNRASRTVTLHDRKFAFGAAGE
jgi:hypothetical protein